MRRYNSDFRTGRGAMENPIDRRYPERSRSDSMDPNYRGDSRRGYGADFGRSRGGGQYDRGYSAGGSSRARNTAAHGDPGRPTAQRRGYDQRGGERSGRQMQDPSRALRYDGGFNTYGRANTGGFSEGYLGSGF